MENNDNIVMSRIAFERMQSRDERNDRWKNIIIVLLIVLLVVTNAMWLVAWNQYDYVEDYTQVDSGDGDINYIGHNGDISNGEGDKSNTEQDSQNGK